MANPTDRVNLDIVREGTFRHQFFLVDDAGDPIDLNGYAAYLQMREAPGGVLLYDCSTELGNLTIDTLLGAVYLTIPSWDTEDFEFELAQYDLFVVDALSNSTPVARGAVRVYASITDVP